MMRRVLATIALSFCMASRAAGQAEIAVDYVILVDVSKSMNGFGGSPIIFPQVKERLKQRIRQLDPGQMIYIQPFADGLRPGRRFSLRSPPERQAALAFVEGLQANGSNTYIYNSLARTFSEYAAFRGDRPNRVAAVFVYTDGLDNGPEHRTMQQMIRDFGLKRQQYDHLYYSTLGVRLSDSDRAAFADVDYVTYDDSPKGQVHDVIIVEPRYPALDFGNLLTAGAAAPQMEQRFRIRGTLPTNYKMALSSRFPTLDGMRGPAAEVTPDSASPLQHLSIGLELVNARNVQPDRYTGFIKFSSPEPEILIIPSSIAAYFSYQPPRWVRLGAGEPLRLGTLDPYRAERGTDSAHAAVALSYDPLTRRAGGTFRVHVEQSENNPQPLPPTAFGVNNVSGLQHRIDARRASRLDLRIRVTPGDVRPGHYEGVVVLEPGDIGVTGRDTLHWNIDVVTPPWPSWLRAMVGAGILLVIAGCVRMSRPRLRGRLVVERGPEPGRTILLGSDTRIFLGPAATSVPPEKAVLTLQARGVRWLPRVAAEAGPEVTVARPSEGLEIPADSEELQDDDLVKLGDAVHLRYKRY